MSERDRLLVIALASACGAQTGNRERAPFVKDDSATAWKLLRKRYVEVQLPERDRGTPSFRPTARGWHLYDLWLKEA